MNDQLDLFPSSSMPAAFFSEGETARNPVYTAARFFSAQPDKYKAIVALSAEGLGVLRIAGILRVSPHTVLAVRQRSPSDVAIEKQRLASISREAARMCVDGILDILSDPERAAKVPARDLGILGGILTDKAELLSGGPTMRIEHQRDVSPEDVQEYLAGLHPAREVGVMGLEAESGSAKGGGGAGRAERQEIPAGGAIPAGAVVEPAAADPGAADQGPSAAPGAACGVRSEGAQGPRAGPGSRARAGAPPRGVRG